MAISIRYPNSPQGVDPSGFLAGLDAIGAGLEDRRGRKAFDQYLGGLYPQGGQQGQQPMSLAALDPSQRNPGGVQRAPLPDVQDPASARVASAHAASGGPQQGAIAAYIRHAAQKRGIDPEVAVRVAMSEGGVSDPTRQSDVVKNGVREQSYGPFQLYMGGGLGNEFQQATGLHPSDPGAWQKGIDFALDKAKEGGWGPWYGAAKAGIGERDGIGTPQGAVDALAGQSGQPMPQIAPQAPQMAQAGQGSMLPPREVMAALFKSRETRPLAIELARNAQAAQQGDPEAALRLRKLTAEINQLENPTARDKFGNSVIWGQDASGKWVAMQPSSGGGLVPADVPEGINLSPPGVGNLDLGNQIAVRDRNGNVVNTVDKNLAAAERDKVVGKDLGEAEALYSSMTSKMPGLRQVADRLDTLSEEATYTLAGRTWDEARKQFGADPRAAAAARAEYEAVIDNQILPLLRDTFGAQFTVVEGERLRDTLGDPNMSPVEKKAVLKAFIDQKERDIEALATRTGNNAGGGASDYKKKYGLE